MIGKIILKVFHPSTKILTSIQVQLFAAANFVLPISHKWWLFSNISEYGQVVVPGKGRYMLQPFRKVAHNIREYAQKVWDDSDKNSWGTLVTTVSILPKIPTENPYFLSLGK